MAEYRRPYGTDALFEFPLIDYGATSFESTPVTIAAGDVGFFSDAQVLTNLTAEYVAFSSGSYEPKNGDRISGNSSGATALVMFSVVTSGTWAGKDAAGYLYLKSVTSSFATVAAEPVHILSGGPSSATSTVLSTATDPVAGLFAYTARGLYSAALTDSEMSCKQGWIVLMDQSNPKLWEDTMLAVVTEGHERAYDPQGCILTDSTDTATGQTTTNLVFSDTLATLGVTPRAGNYVETYDATNGYQEGFVKSVSGDDVTLYPPGLQIGALPTGAQIKVYRAARTPAQVVALEADSITAAAIADNAIDAGAIASNAITTAKVAAGAYSGVTVGISNIAGGTYSDVTIQGLSNYANISNVTLAAGSNVTIGASTITLNANIVQITGDAVTGSGTTADPWRPS